MLQRDGADRDIDEEGGQRLELSQWLDGHSGHDLTGETRRWGNQTPLGSDSILGRSTVNVS